VQTASESEMTKTCWNGCLILLPHTSEYHTSELIRTVDAVTESITNIKESLDNTVICHFDMLENAHF